ncbi:hypothetical protein UlMin_001188 [Ulmus minor]
MLFHTVKFLYLWDYFCTKRQLKKLYNGFLHISRSQMNINFIDKTFSIVANVLLRIILTTSREKESFVYYRHMVYIFYNIGLIHTGNREHTKALEYYFRALERNIFLPQAFNNMVMICHYMGEHAIRQEDFEIMEAWFNQAIEYWKQAIMLTPGNYIETHNWLKITSHFE